MSQRPDEAYHTVNYRVYRAADGSQTYLVSGTSILPQGTDRPALKDAFNPSTIDELAAEIAAAAKDRTSQLTIRVHGYNNRRSDFERSILEDADPSRHFHGKAGPSEESLKVEGFKPPGVFYIGFWWQSEGLGSRESLRDTAKALGYSPAVGWALFLLPTLGLIFHGCGTTPSNHTLIYYLLFPFLNPSSAVGLLGAGVILVLLRLSTYLRDRYRALHYGVPDFGEFIRGLEQRLRGTTIIHLSVIGHSMGALVLINAFRVMTDYLATDPEQERIRKSLGKHGTIQLHTMIICAPDIPALMATPDHNNYFLAALRRFREVHILTSDRDVTLKWLSLIGNWAIEPRHDMAGRKLGNALLVRMRAPWERYLPKNEQSLWPVTRPVWRPFPLYVHNPGSVTTEGRESPARSETIHFHDCTLDPSLSGSLPTLAAAFLVVLLALALIGLGVPWAVEQISGDVFWHWSPTLTWIVLAYLLFVLAGLVCRQIWPWARDRGKAGGIIGMLVDWPTTLVFLMSKWGWNPHSGYFAFGRPPRHRISALLRREPGWPDGPSDTIRYQPIKLCV